VFSSFVGRSGSAFASKLLQQAAEKANLEAAAAQAKAEAAEEVAAAGREVVDPVETWKWAASLTLTHGSCLLKTYIERHDDCRSM
jgi:hypothetical protein